jgi:WD40 repeat protein
MSRTIGRHRQPSRLPRWSVPALLILILSTLTFVAPAARAQTVCAAAQTYLVQTDLMQRDCDGTSTTLFTGIQTDGSGDAAVSPDGQYVAWVPLGDVRIWVKSKDGTQNGPVTSAANNQAALNPAWSPDSQQLVYASYDRPTDANHGLSVVGRDGANPHQIASGNDRNPSWSPDGARIASVHIETDGRTSLYVQPATGQDRRALYDPPAGVGVGLSAPAWTPDSNYLVFSRSAPDDPEIYGDALFAVSAAGGPTVRLHTRADYNSQGVRTETAIAPSISPNWQLSYADLTDRNPVIQPILDPDHAETYAVSALSSWPRFYQVSPASPAPPGWPPAGLPPPGPTPDPTPTPGPTPTPSGFGVKDVNIIGSRADRILTRTIKFVPNDNTPLLRYEYAWAAIPTATVPGTTIQKCAITLAKCLLNYGPTTPNTMHNLLVRAVAKDGKASLWFIKSVTIPPAFRLVVWGDSVAAGHHRDSEGAPTICQDETYSYGQTIWDELQSQIPPQWRLEHGYVNVAHSGFGTSQTMFGGVDACGNNWPAELPQIFKILREDEGSWDWVVGTAGINDTLNWPDVLKNIISDNFVGKIKTEEQCDARVQQWNLLTAPAVGPSITANLKNIYGKLEAANSMARLTHTGYYNIAGTGTSKAKVPAICRVPFAAGMGKLHEAMKQGLNGTNVRWVDTDPTLGLRDNLLQQLYPSDAIFTKSGWPHPNQKGANKIGRLVLAA